MQEKDEAIIALGKIKNVQSIQQLHFAKYMFESFPKTPGKATEILRSIGEKNENAIPILIETLSSNFIGFRKQAAESLGEIGGNQSILPLMKALKDSDKSVRLSAALALGQIGDPVAIKNIVFAAASDWDEHLANTKGEYLVALEGIVKNNATAVYSYLSELINHENSNVRKIVLDQLYRINSDKSFNYLLIP